MGFFGTMLILSAADATYIFIALLMFLLIFKAGLHILEIYCNRNGFKELLENLYREFMMMGLISFGVFVSNEAYDYANSTLYNSFHFAHMLILFIGLTFILQAILIIVLVASRKGVLLRFSLISSNQLLDDYHKLMSSNNIQSLLFRNGPLSISFPELREKIENRILKDFFIRSFNLPEEFNFAIYTCRALKSYVISLSEVRPLNWFILAILAAINYAKVRILDERLKELHCFVGGDPDRNQKGNQPVVAQSSGLISNRDYGSYTSQYSNPISHGFTPEMVKINLNESGSRSLVGGVFYTEAELCREYFLSYSVFCAFMLTLFLTALLIVSEVYMRRLLDKVLEMEIDLEWQDVEEVQEEESSLLQDADQLAKEKEKEIEKEQEKDIVDITETIATTTPSLSLINTVPSTDSAPPTFSLQLPVSLPSSPVRSSSSTFAPIQLTPHPQSADFIPHPSPTSNSAKHFPALPSSLQSHSRRSRSVTSPEPYDEKLSNFRSKIHAIGKGRAQSMNRGRSHTVNFGLPDGHAHRESIAMSPLTPEGSRKRSLTLGIGGVSALGSESSTPRLPPQCVILEHEQQMKEIGRVRSNTFIQYMSDSLPVTLLNSRFLYQKCLERICRAEEDRHLRNRKTIIEHNPAPPISPILTPTPVVPKSIITKTEKPYAYMNSGKEGYERNPLLLPPGSSDYPPEPSPVTPIPAPYPRFVGPPTDSFLTKPTTSPRDSIRLSVSPRLGACRQRSFTAENILNRAAFQSQHRSMKMTSKDQNEVSPATSFQPVGLSSTSLDPSDGLESGMRGTMDISPRFCSSSASSTLTRLPMWPTAEPEYPVDVTADAGREGAVRGKNGSGTETLDSDNVDENTCANTAKNAHIASSIVSLSGTKAMQRNDSGSRNSPLGDDRRAPKGRMERAYSDIFFQMAAPENVADIKANQIDNNHSHHTIANKSKYVLYNPAHHKKKSRKHLNTICEEVCNKIGKKALSLLRCFFYGLYEILILGPGVGEETEEDNQDDEVRIALQKDLSSIFLWGNSDLYFRAIEFSLLLQCVYIALWCTNFALVAAEADNSVKWELFLLIPIPLNFLLLKLVLNFACVLRSASVLDEEIAVKICEEAIDERVVTQRLRKMVRTSLLDIEPEKSNWSLFLMEVFSHYVPDNRPGLSTKQFSLFLHGIQIHLSKKSIERIFKVIDFDHSGYITWTEISSIIFPELFGPPPAASDRTDGIPIPPMAHMESTHTAPTGTDGTYPTSSTNLHRLRQMSIEEDDIFELDPELDSKIPGSPRTLDPVSQKNENISNLVRSPRRNGSKDQGETRSRVVSFSEPQRERVMSISPPIDRMVSFQDEKESRDHVNGHGHVHALQLPVEQYDDATGDDSEDGQEMTDDAEEVALAHADVDEGEEEDRIIHLEKIDEAEDEEEED